MTVLDLLFGGPKILTSEEYNADLVKLIIWVQQVTNRTLSYKKDYNVLKVRN